MRSIENTQSRIKNIVSIYKQEFPNEYKAVVNQIDKNRRLNNDEYASVIGEHALKRRLYEIPEKLSISLYKVLDDEENQWFISKGGVNWFMKTFPEFRNGYKM